MFRTLLLSSTLLLGLASAASAADMAMRPAPAVPVPAGFSWAGTYVGAELGMGWAQNDLTAWRNGAFYGQADISGRGALGGIFAGHNWQSGNVVYGLEADIEWSGVKGDFTASGNSYSYALPIQGSARARLGWAFDRALVYGTGGVAVASIATNYVGNDYSHVRAGWTIGAGLDYAFTDNLFARLEYRYVDFAGFTDVLTSGRTTMVFGNNPTEHLVHVGLAYKFGGPSAVVAKY